MKLETSLSRWSSAELDSDGTDRPVPISVILRDTVALRPRVKFGVEPIALTNCLRLSISFFNSLNLQMKICSIWEIFIVFHTKINFKISKNIQSRDYLFSCCNLCRTWSSSSLCICSTCDKSCRGDFRSAVLIRIFSTVSAESGIGVSFPSCAFHNLKCLTL